jgi:hypothetical protein
MARFKGCHRGLDGAGNITDRVAPYQEHSDVKPANGPSIAVVNGESVPVRRPERLGIGRKIGYCKREERVHATADEELPFPRIEAQAYVASFGSRDRIGIPIKPDDVLPASRDRLPATILTVHGGPEQKCGSEHGERSDIPDRLHSNPSVTRLNRPTSWPELSQSAWVSFANNFTRAPKPQCEIRRSHLFPSVASFLRNQFAVPRLQTGECSALALGGSRNRGPCGD